MSKNIVGCGCSGSTNNTGYLGQKTFGIKSSIFIVPILDADGAKNGLDLTADLETEILSKVNNVDPTKRWYPIHELVNFVPSQEETQYATTNGGENAFLRKGIKSDVFEIWGASAQQFAKVKGFCFNFGIIEVDECNSVRGRKLSATDTMLYPRKVNVQSWDAQFMDKDDSNVNRIVFGVQYDRSDDHSKLWLVPSSYFGVNTPLDLNGLVDVLVDVTAVTATTFDVTVKGTFGNAVNLIGIGGLLAADVTVYNTTTDSAETVSTLVADATEVGKYLLTVSSTPTTADLLNFDVFKAALGAELQGFEGSVDGIVSL